MSYSIPVKAPDAVLQLDHDLGSLLQPSAIISTTPMKEFVAKDYFRPHLSSRSPLRLSLGDDFTKLFIPKVEYNLDEDKINVSILLRPSRDPEIMHELGRWALIYLTYFYQALKAQGRGQPGPLLTNGLANIAYALAVDDNVWTVYAVWNKKSWHVDAYSIKGLDGWSSGSQVISLRDTRRKFIPRNL